MVTFSMLKMSKYLIYHPSHPLSVQKLFLSWFSAEHSLLKSVCLFYRHVPYVDQSSKQHSPVGLYSGWGGRILWKQHESFYLFYASPSYHAVHTVEDRRYCIVQMVSGRNIGYVQRTRTICIAQLMQSQSISQNLAWVGSIVHSLSLSLLSFSLLFFSLFNCL